MPETGENRARMFTEDNGAMKLMPALALISLLAIAGFGVLGYSIHRELTMVYVSAAERIERGDACRGIGVAGVTKPYRQPWLVTCLDGTVEQIDGRREDK